MMSISTVCTVTRAAASRGCRPVAAERPRGIRVGVLDVVAETHMATARRVTSPGGGEAPGPGPGRRPPGYLREITAL